MLLSLLLLLAGARAVVVDPPRAAIEFPAEIALARASGDALFPVDAPNATWATGSGASTFYNTPVDGGAAANTRMARDFGADSFEIFATRDIAAGDELLHEYKSKAWRACFSDLRS